MADDVNSTETQAVARRSWVVPALVGLISWCLVQLSETVILVDERSRHLTNLDRNILLWQMHLRRPWLNGLAVEVTAIGSATVLVVFTAVVVTVCTWRSDRRAAHAIALAWAASTVLAVVTKRWLARPRPTEIPHLVDVIGYSYPSGHSLGAAAVYLTSALVLSRRLPRRGQRIATVIAAFAMVIAIGASRVYLGVHYPTDVLGGFLLGCLWALLALAWIRWRERNAMRLG